MQIPAEHFNLDPDPSKLVVPDPTTSVFDVQLWDEAKAAWEKSLEEEK